jgi:hypothetical protein
MINYDLQKIYARLNEPDAVHGIMATRGQEPSLEELIIAHEVTGHLQVCKIVRCMLGNVLAVRD